MSAALIGAIAIVWTGAEENALRKQRGAFMKERRDLLTEQGRLHATLTMEGNLSRVQAAVERLRLPLAPPSMRPGQTVPVLAEIDPPVNDSDVARVRDGRAAGGGQVTTRRISTRQHVNLDRSRFDAGASWHLGLCASCFFAATLVIFQQLHRLQVQERDGLVDRI